MKILNWLAGAALLVAPSLAFGQNSFNLSLPTGTGVITPNVLQTKINALGTMKFDASRAGPLATQAGATPAQAITNGLGFTPINPNQIGVSNGVAPLNGSAQVPSANMPIASSSQVGGVKQGANVTIAGDGTISSSGAVQSVATLTGAIASSSLAAQLIGTSSGTVAAAIDTRFDGRDYYAPFFGSCTWDSTHDVGPCVNAAISAAVASGANGGTVILPAGIYGLATSIGISNSKIHLVGQGTGIVRDNAIASFYLGATRLVWIGTADGGPMLDVEPINIVPTTQSLYSDDVTGIVFDCADLADVCAKFASVNSSTIHIGYAEPRIVGAWLTTNVMNDSPGMQNNDVWIEGRSTLATHSPTGILINGAVGSNWNVSYNRFWHLYAWYSKGDGIVFGNNDNNIAYDVETFAQPTISSGRPAVSAAAGYTMPNGLSTSLTSSDLVIHHLGTFMYVQGFQDTSTLTPSGSNTGTAVVSTFTQTTSASVSRQGTVIPFVSTTGITAGEVMNCGGTLSGIPYNQPVPVNPASSTSLVISPYQATNTVASGTVCTFSYGIKNTAVKGTYTITALSGSTFSVTAPTGGHTQASVNYASGTIAATDFTIPMTGTPVVGDTWTLVIGQPSVGIKIHNLDEANSFPNPLFEPGATGAFDTTRNIWPVQFGSGVALFPGGGLPGAASLGSVAIGNGTSAGGTTSLAAGLAASAQGFASQSIGFSANSSGVEDSAVGTQTTATGQYSMSYGAFSNDNGRFGINCQANGSAADQTCHTDLYANSTVTTGVRLTSNGSGTAGLTNTVNIATNTVFATQVIAGCIDTTNGDTATWNLQQGQLSRVAGNAAYVGDASTAIAASRSTGAGSTATLQVTQDATNQGLAVTAKWPNTDLTHCHASVTNAETQ